MHLVLPTYRPLKEIRKSIKAADTDLRTRKQRQLLYASLQKITYILAPKYAENCDI